MKKVSIIIPIYKVEQYLRECLESVVNQTLKDIEIILVDDCSPDNSIEIAEEYAKKDSRIKIIKHTKNQGLGPARNTGIDVASGEYIFFLDSDDYLKNDVLELLYNKASSSNANVTISQAEAFTDLSDEYTIQRVKDLNNWLDCRKLEDFYIDIDNFADAINNINCVAWGKLYSREFLIKNNIRFVNGKVIHEDNGFWLKVCSQFPKIAFIQEIGVYYRIRENAITTEIDKKKNHRKKHKHMRMVLKDVFSYIKKYANDEFYKFFITQIKNSSEYSRYFYIKLGFLYKFRWLKNEKCIKILGIPLFIEKIKGNNCKIRRIFGIKIYKTNVKSCKKPRNIIKERRIEKVLDEKYVFPYLKGEIKNINLQAKKNLKTDKIIWQYWGQGFDKIPDIVKICFNSVDKYKGEYTIIRLSNETICEYIDLPNYVYDKLNDKKFGYAHFSDLLRVCLLTVYGGVWIDATILLTNNINEEYLQQDFFSFQRTKRPSNYKFWNKYNKDYFVWDKNFKVNWLNSFIVAKKDNCIANALKNILLAFWQNENKMEEYFTMHFIFDSLIKYEPYKNFNKLIMSDLPPHLMQINLKNKYTLQLWNKIISESNIHKLTYIELDNINRSNTILDKVMKNNDKI